MYLKSASVGLQAEAILAAAAKWGEGLSGSEEIPFSVCKRKYQPKKCIGTGDEDQGKASEETLMFGCYLHTGLRERRVLRNGPRSGWERFDYWHDAKETASTDVKYRRKDEPPNLVGTKRKTVEGPTKGTS